MSSDNRSTQASGLVLPAEARAQLWDQIAKIVEEYTSCVATLPVSPGGPPSPQAWGKYDFRKPRGTESVVNEVAALLKTHLLHTSHPAYFGVFNPAPSTLGIAGEWLAAAFNPQLASSASGAICTWMENQILEYFGNKFGFPETTLGGQFTSGGTEANHSAVLCALNHSIPGIFERGISAHQPVIYTSVETHHSILRAARLSGLGTQSVRELPVNARLQLDPAALRAAIEEDRKARRLPLLIVATLGSTSAGVCDDLPALVSIARENRLWLHVDAAWGGAAILLPEMQQLFAGTAHADSLTLDAHKWLSVPMGCGLFLVRDKTILRKTFTPGESVYMPIGTHQSELTEPYQESMQWSRRFMGLKVFLTLAAHGESGYEIVLRHQIEMGNYLRNSLRGKGWKILNETPLPVVCFSHEKIPDGAIEDFANAVKKNRKTWITTTHLHSISKNTLRAGIPNFRTQKEHIDLLMHELNTALAERNTL